MFAVLDPHLFDEDGPTTRWDDVLKILRRTGAAIPNGPYWRTLYQDAVRLCYKRSPRQVRRTIQAIERLVIDVPGVPSGQAQINGFDELFGSVPHPLRPILHDEFDRLALMEEPVILIARTDARNLHPTPWEKAVVHEFAPWELRVEIPPDFLLVVACVRMFRNIVVPETARLDERLPFTADGADFPFCTPSSWRDPNVSMVVTHRSRPCVKDAQMFHWARPKTGGGHHWDVFLTRKVGEAYGIDYLNIGSWPGEEGKSPGCLHHPGAGGFKLKKETGWKC